MQQSSAIPKNQDVGIGLWKIVAYSHSSSQCLLVSTVFGTVSSLHPTSFLMIFILVSHLDCSTRRDDITHTYVRSTHYTYIHVHAYCARELKRKL